MVIPVVPSSESTLTDRYQTTVPDPIRKFLGLSKRDRIRYTIESDGRVIISRVEREEIDSILDKFLAFLEGDLEKNPQQIKAIDADLVDRIENLVESVEIDLDAPLADEDE